MTGTEERPAFVLWLTGLPGAGKTTLGDLVYERLSATGRGIERLDGDSLRQLFPQTGFSRDAREEHIRRVGHLAGLLEKHGVIVVASFVSPFIASRDFARGLCSRFIEVYLDASAEVCERRDPKGLYRAARSGEIRNFTGIDAPYETPPKPELVIPSGRESVGDCSRRIFEYLQARSLM